MPKTDSPDTLAALALVPEQLPAYVRSVAGSELRFTQGFPVYLAGGEAVLVGYLTANDFGHGGNPSVELQSSGIYIGSSPSFLPRLDAAIAEVSGWKGLSRLNLLAPVRPASVPSSGEAYSETQDVYLALDLPYFEPSENFSGVPGQKLRNMLRRAARDLVIAREGWSAECQALACSYAASRPLEAGTRYIFEHLEAYTSQPAVQVFTARSKADGSLQGLSIGDFTPLATAFYMFAFRQREAVPGCADLLLYSVVEEAQRQGHERVNLGLAINGGIGFFKQKWGAKNFLPLVECSWPIVKQKKSFFKNLFG